MKSWSLVLLVLFVICAACCGQTAAQTGQTGLGGLLSSFKSVLGFKSSSEGESARGPDAPKKGMGNKRAKANVAIPPYSPDPPSLYEGVYNFGVNFLEGYRALYPNDNVVFSPLSLMTSLSLVYFGSEGSTQELMESILGFQKGSIPNALIKKGSISAQNSVVAIGNKAYFAEELPVLESYKAAVGAANVESVPFVTNSRSALKKINGYVNSATRGLIPEIVTSEHVTPLTEMVLVNAVYFKGIWKYTFDMENTKKLEFRGVGGATMVDFMIQKNSVDFRYGEIPELDSLVVEIPYNGNQFAMFIVLPMTDGGWRSVEESLASAPPLFFQRAVKFGDKVLLSLPKWELGTSVDEATGILVEMGLDNLFSRSADLTGIVDGGLRLTDVVHKAKIIVSEEGTEAAAASAVISSRSIGKPSSPREIVVDHPFLYYIMDQSDYSILFQGTVTTLS